MESTNDDIPRFVMSFLLMSNDKCVRFGNATVNAAPNDMMSMPRCFCVGNTLFFILQQTTTQVYLQAFACRAHSGLEQFGQ